MAVQGAFILFQRGLLHLQDANVDLDAGGLKAVLLTSAQAMTNAFVGASADCRYADLTGELATANGYTVGGVTLAGVVLSITGGYVKFSSNPISWTLTGAGVTFKYLVIYDNLSTNKNLICFTDMDTAGGNVSPIAGALTVTPDGNGIFRSIN